MASSCSDARHSLLECLADSPCFLSGKTVKECVLLTKEQNGCKEFNTALYHCRRGQLDMSKRIKGNKYYQGEVGAEKDADSAPRSS